MIYCKHEWLAVPLAAALTATLATIAGCAGRRPDVDVRGDTPSAPGARAGDARLRTAVRRAVASIPGAHAARVSVDARGGVVSLRGEVDNIVVARRIADTVQVLHGVFRVADELTLSPAGARSDAEIGAQVKRALLSHPATEAGGIRVSAAAGVVRLEGSVSSAAVRSLAGDLASQVRGVGGVQNRLVAPAPIEPRSDGELHGEITRRLRRSPGVATWFVQVDVSGGVVALDGTVPDVGSLRALEALAWVPGVTQVDADHVQVAWTAEAPRGDAELARRVTAALLRDSYLDSEQIRVHAQDGRVRLDGAIDARHELARAARVAASVPGVREVENRLVYGNPAVSPREEALRATVEELLIETPGLVREEMTIVVDDRTVTLLGTVSDVEERHAAEAAARTAGAARVVNLLVVRRSPSTMPEPRSRDALRRGIR